ncbi:MAG: radical SAM protein, partial [Senegalia sp. (in: firmicutes)]
MNRLAKWDITDACNLRCKHCYNIVDKSNKFNKYHIDEIELQNFINNLKINNFTDLHLLGGEPLIINNLSEIISRLNSEGISVGITTNALLLNKILSKALLNSGISSIIISLDGFTKTDNDKIRGMGTFEKVIENIKQLIEINNVLKTNTKISISFTINGINYKNVDNIIDIIYHTKINSILLSFLDIEGNAEKNWNELGINKIKAIDSLEKLIDITKNIPNLYIEVVCKK